MSDIWFKLQEIKPSQELVVLTSNAKFIPNLSSDFGDGTSGQTEEQTVYPDNAFILYK
jgi:hypothetical protein